MEEGKIKNKLEADLMREICQENIEEGELIEQLLMLQKSKYRDSSYELLYAGNNQLPHMLFHMLHKLQTPRHRRGTD